MNLCSLLLVSLLNTTPAHVRNGSSAEGWREYQEFLAATEAREDFLRSHAVQSLEVVFDGVARVPTLAVTARAEWLGVKERWARSLLEASGGGAFESMTSESSTPVHGLVQALREQGPTSVDVSDGASQLSLSGSNEALAWSGSLKARTDRRMRAGALNRVNLHWSDEWLSSALASWKLCWTEVNRDHADLRQWVFSSPGLRDSFEMHYLVTRDSARHLVLEHHWRNQTREEFSAMQADLEHGLMNAWARGRVIFDCVVTVAVTAEGWTLPAAARSRVGFSRTEQLCWMRYDPSRPTSAEDFDVRASPREVLGKISVRDETTGRTLYLTREAIDDAARSSTESSAMNGTIESPRK